MLASNRPSIQSFSPSAHDSGTLGTLVMARPAGRRRIVLENQGLLGIAFFEASAFVILLVLFPLFRREQPGGYFRFWHAGWFCFTFSAVFEVIFLARPLAGLHLACLVTHTAAVLLFLVAAVNRVASPDRRYLALPVITFVLAVVYYVERSGPQRFASVLWEIGRASCREWRWGAQAEGRS